MSDLVEFRPLNDYLVRGVGADLRLEVAVGGTLAEASSVSVAVVGQELGTVTTSAVAALSTGDYGAFVDGPDIAGLDQLDAVWTVVFGAVTHTFEASYLVVSDVLFTLEQVRSLDTGRLTPAKLSDRSALELRQIAVETFQDFLGFHIGARYERVVVGGSGFTTVVLPRYHCSAVRSLSIDGAAVTFDEDSVQVEDWGELWYDGGFPTTRRRNVTVGLEHGLDPVPHRLRRAGLDFLKGALSPSETNERAIIVTDETGTYRLQQPDNRDRPTGIPQVDSVLSRLRLPGIA
jgi:hypothetical protein